MCYRIWFLMQYVILSEEELEDLRDQLETLKTQLKTEEKEHYFEVERSKTELYQSRARIRSLEEDLADIIKKYEEEKINLTEEVSGLKDFNNEMNLKICVFLEQLSDYKTQVEKLKLELQYSRKKSEEMEEEKDRCKSELASLHQQLVAAEKKGREAVNEKEQRVDKLESRLQMATVKEKEAISELTIIKEDIMTTNQDYRYETQIID